jgi:septal ring factor EnvC (AmiA/AmiB activator)
MPRAGVTREQVLQAAEGLAAEGVHPTVQAVRARLGSGSPNRITPWLAEWRKTQTPPQDDGLPELPPAIDHAMRHLWALAWQQARAQLARERQALNGQQQALERERDQLSEEVARLQAEAAREQDSQRQVRQTLALSGQALRALEHQLSEERQARQQAEQQLAELRIELATLRERASQQEQLTQLIERLRDQPHATEH